MYSFTDMRPYIALTAANPSTPVAAICGSEQVVTERLIATVERRLTCIFKGMARPMPDITAVFILLGESVKTAEWLDAR